MCIKDNKIGFRYKLGQLQLRDEVQASLESELYVVVVCVCSVVSIDISLFPFHKV